MQESKYWKDLFDKLLAFSSVKIAELEMEKEYTEVKLAEARYKLHSLKIVTND